MAESQIILRESEEKKSKMAKIEEFLKSVSEIYNIPAEGLNNGFYEMLW